MSGSVRFLARVSPDIVSSHDLAAPFPPSGLRRALAIALTTTAIVVQWTSDRAGFKYEHDSYESSGK